MPGELTEAEATALYKATRSPFYTIPTRVPKEVKLSLGLKDFVDSSWRITDTGRAVLARYRGETK